MKNAIDTLLEKVISRKLMAWVVTIVLLALFAIFDWEVQDRLVEIFRDVTMIYIGTVGAIDTVNAFRGKPTLFSRVTDTLVSKDTDTAKKETDDP